MGLGAGSTPWQGGRVTVDPLQRRLRDALYAETMLLADEARGYFDDELRRETGPLDPLARVQVSCESLKVTTRLLHAVAWLLTWRAVDAGEIGPAEARSPSRRLGASPANDAAAHALMPERARALATASIDLHRRVARLDRATGEAAPSPARSIQDRLARVF
jgi:regulator of CtrA degradation